MPPEKNIYLHSSVHPRCRSTADEERNVKVETLMTGNSLQDVKAVKTMEDFLLEAVCAKTLL